MRKTTAIPTPENVKKVAGMWERAKERADKLVEKKIDPAYFELAGKVAPWLKEKSKYAPWILEQIMSVDAARLAFRLPDPYRDPSWGREHLGVTEQLAKEVGLDKDTADWYLDELEQRAFVNATRNGYQIVRGSQSFHIFHGNKFFLSLPDDKKAELQDLCLVWSRFELQPPRDQWIAHVKERGGRQFAGWPIIPRWKSIKDVPGVLPVEDMREILKAHEKFCALRCICKNESRERECDVPLEVCMTFDRGAERQVGRGRGRALTLKETLDMIDSWSEYPIVHLPMAGMVKDPKELMTICNCHWDCCLALTAYYLGDKYSQWKISDFLYKNRFRATVDPENCIGCRVCIDERCQFEACQMKYYPEFGEERAYIDEEKCMGCGLCVETCTVGCRGMKIVEPPEYVMEMPLEEGVRAAGLSVENLMEVATREKAEREAKKE